jgi:hypothetical protein
MSVASTDQPTEVDGNPIPPSWEWFIVIYLISIIALLVVGSIFVYRGQYTWGIGLIVAALVINSAMLTISQLSKIYDGRK